MNEQLPPVALVKSWISVIHTDEVPLDVVNTKRRLINKHFGSIELASLYVEQQLLK